jgi:hypothetical protein
MDELASTRSDPWATRNTVRCLTCRRWELRTHALVVGSSWGRCLIAGPYRTDAERASFPFGSLADVVDREALDEDDDAVVSRDELLTHDSFGCVQWEERPTR